MHHFAYRMSEDRLLPVKHKWCVSMVIDIMDPGLAIADGRSSNTTSALRKN